MSDPQGPPVPAGSGRARDLVGRRQQRKARDSGRVHHLGAAPPMMPVLHDGGTESTTRTAAVQLASRTRWELERLAEDLTAEMAAASTALDFERAARLRDEVQRVQAELERRAH
jgi:excinuclease UvrABC helicase subunit UvrB